MVPQELGLQRREVCAMRPLTGVALLLQALDKKLSLTICCAAGHLTSVPCGLFISFPQNCSAPVELTLCPVCRQ